VPVDDELEHRCEQQRYIEYQMLLHRQQIAAFELQFNDWLRTPHGRFASYYATRQRLAFAA
jgi:hypothetical protein